MSAFKRKPRGREEFRSDGAGDSPAAREPGRMHCSHRGPGDDFFCQRYGVWYASLDCAIRSRYRTCAGCLDCDQGRFNLKRHAAGLGRIWGVGPGLDRG